MENQYGFDPDILEKVKGAIGAGAPPDQAIQRGKIKQAERNYQKQQAAGNVVTPYRRQTGTTITTPVETKTPPVAPPVTPPNNGTVITPPVIPPVTTPPVTPPVTPPNPEKQTTIQPKPPENWLDTIKKYAGMAADVFTPKTKEVVTEAMARPQDYAKSVGQSIATIAGPAGEYIAGKLTGDKEATKVAQSGAELASFALPVGKGITGLMKSGATSGALQGLSKGQDLDATKGLIGAGTGAITSGAIGLAGEGIKRGGKALYDYGKKYALKALDIPGLANKATKFAEQTGEKLEDFVLNNKLVDTGIKNVHEVTRPIQEAYDEAAIKSGKTVDASKISQFFDEAAEPLRKSFDKGMQQIANQLDEAKAIFIERAKQSGGKIDLADIVNDRRLIDKTIPQSAFNKEPIAGGLDTVKRQVYKNIIDDTTKGATAEIGKQLQKMYLFEQMAEAAENKGIGNMVGGLMPMLSFGVGFSAPGKDTNERIRNGVIATLGQKALNNPKVIEWMSKAMMGAGQKMSGSLPEITTKIGQKLATPLSGAAAGLPTQQPTQAPQEKQSGQQIIENKPIVGTQSTTPPSGATVQQTVDKSQIQAPQKTLKDIQDEDALEREALKEYYSQELQKNPSNKKNIDAQLDADLKEQDREYEKKVALYNDEIKNKPKGSEPMAAASAQVVGKSRSALRAVKKIEEEFAKNPLVTTLEKVPGKLGARSYAAAISSLNDALGGLRTGASVSPQQQEFYGNMMIQPYDSSEDIKYKLDALKQELKEYEELITGEQSSVKSLPKIATSWNAKKLGIA